MPEPSEPASPDETPRDQPSEPGPGQADSTTPADAAARASVNSGPEESDEKAAKDPGEQGNAAEEPADDLPEWEPLTPDDVEDEAVRGDFVLRWAVVLLAFLLACTGIVESGVLVHVRSGEYMLSNGVLPPATDVFSSTAGDRPWINLSWLFDILLAVAWKAGGPVALSLFRAVLVAATFGILVHISLNRVSTWWGSILASLALLAAWPLLTVEPQTVTLLGLAVELWLLYRWQITGNSRMLLAVPAVLLVWANLDPRAFIGLYLLLLFVAGEFIDSLRTGRNSQPLSEDESTADRDTRPLWLALALSVPAMLVNPFGWHSLLSPVSLYGAEYPALRAKFRLSSSAERLEYFPILHGEFWANLSASSIAGMLVVVAAVLSLVLNRRRVRLSWVLVLAGFAVLACAVSHELAAAAVVSVVVCVLNSQDWYRNRFRQSYTVERSELIFSRGGRAVTVAALFALSWLAISGRMTTADGRRVGLGWSPQLAADLSAMEEELGESFDKKPFNFLLPQGDLLIWIGRQPFIDSRLKLYLGGNGQENLVELHNRTRHALRQKRTEDPLSGRPDVWKAAFDKFGITHVIPRLAGRNPDYFTYLDLLKSPAWQLTHLGAATATFYRADTDQAELNQWLAEHRVQFVEEAFRGEPTEPVQRVDWPRKRSGYQNLLSVANSRESNAIQLAQHLERHLELAASGQIAIAAPLGAAMAHLAIRHANEGLAEDVNNAAGYRVLAGAYVYLGIVESQLGGGRPGGYDESRRYYQAIHALHQADMLAPEHPETLRRLFDAYASRRRYDLALNTLDRFVRALQQQPELNAQEQELVEQSAETRKQLEETIAGIRGQLDKLREQEASPIVLAQQAWQNGLVLDGLAAIDTMIKMQPEVSGAPPLQLLQAAMLMESGNPERAVELVEQAQAAAAQIPPSMQWRHQAALALLAHADYDAAAELWKQEATELELQRMIQMLQALPLVSSPRNWPLQQTTVAAQALFATPVQIAGQRLNEALCHLESGRLNEAEAAFRQLLEIAPESPLRPLAGFYLYQLTEELIDMQPPSNRIPIKADMFADEQQPAAAKTEDRSPASARPPVEAPRPQTAPGD